MTNQTNENIEVIWEFETIRIIKRDEQQIAQGTISWDDGGNPHWFDASEELAQHIFIASGRYDRQAPPMKADFKVIWQDDLFRLVQFRLAETEIIQMETKVQPIQPKNLWMKAGKDDALKVYPYAIRFLLDELAQHKNRAEKLDEIRHKAWVSGIVALL